MSVVRRCEPPERGARRRAALAATGLLVVGAGVGVGGAVAAASPAVTSGVIHACYSNSTNVLSHLEYPTVKSCPSGSTMISWNATGPQGAQGARGATGAQGARGAQGGPGAVGAVGVQGAHGASGGPGAIGAQGATGPRGSVGPQGATGRAGSQGAPGVPGPTGAPGGSGGRGPQGAAGVQGANGDVSGYSDRRHYSFNSMTTIRSSSVVVASVEVSDSAQLDVTATADLLQSSKSPVSCAVRDVSASGRTELSHTQSAVESLPGSRVDLLINGLLSPSRGAVLQEVCRPMPNGHASALVVDVELTAVSVHRVQTTGGRTQHEDGRGSLRNVFTPPLRDGRPSGGGPFPRTR